MKHTMKRIFVGLSIVLLFGLAASATDDLQQATESGQGASDNRPFKLRAAGQIDLGTGEVMFGGTASHLGLYTANGFLNPNDFSIFGTIEAANGDTLNFTALFSIGPLGEIQATFDIAGGTGRFADAAGTASGPVTLDPDFTFLITAIGNLGY